MLFKTIQQYFSHVKGKVARSGQTNDWHSIKFRPRNRTEGLIRANPPLSFHDGATLKFFEEIRINDDRNILRPYYSYQYKRQDEFLYYFRYDRDPRRAVPIIHEECHLHANQEEPRFITHATSFEEVFDFIIGSFYS